MRDVRGHRIAAGRRALVAGVAVVLWASLLSTGVVAATDTAGARRPAAEPDATRAAQEVRTVWTAEFGLDRPAGLAYDPVRREFLVAGDDPAATPLLRLGPDEQDRGTLALPKLSAPETLAFDGAQDVLTAIDGGDAVQVPSDALERSRPRIQRVPIEGQQLDSPESATFDARTGTWFVLDGGDAIAVVEGRSRTTQPDRIPLTPSDADRVIAFNPGDDLLYVLDAGGGSIDVVDRQGDVQQRFGLAATELSAPVAMTFAPSTDSTDDPGNLNLYVADAGSATTFGGVTELSLATVTAAAAPTDTATLVQTVHTSAWAPASPDPAGIVWTQTPDELVVVDSEVDETTGAGWNNVNLWRSRRDGTVAGTGATYGPTAPSNYSREPTGAAYDVGADLGSARLFVSDDDKRKIFVVKRGPDGQPGTKDDIVTSIDTAVYGGVDTEDPEFDPVSGHLFYLDGVGMEIYRIDPVDGIFGNGNDTKTQFDISHLGPVDFEGLTSNPVRRTLYVGARTTREIFEITHDGTLVRTIYATGISDLRYISGLAVAPASTGGNDMTLWVVDRAVDNGPDPTENDGKLFEISAPNIGTVPGPGNAAPFAADDAVSTPVSTPVTVPVLANDSDPDGDPLTVTDLTQPANGAVQVTGGQTVTYTPDGGFAGSDTFTYTANDGQADSNPATVTVTVTGGGGGPPAAPTFRSAASAIVTKSSGATLTIARPAGVRAGDVLLAQVRHRATDRLTPPAGWTEVGTIVRTAAHHSVYYRIAGGAEPASYTFDQGADKGRMAGGIGAYYGVDPVSPINAWAASAANTSTLVAPNATSTVDNALVVRLWGWRGPQATDPGVGFNAPPAGVTQRWSEQVPHANDDRNRVLAGDHVRAGAGPVGTATAAGSASTLENRRSSFTVILAPAPGG